MIITYLRSSSYTAHEMCPMRYFIEYNLGWRGPSNKKAEKGTIVHKVMEILGNIKLTIQEGKRKTFDDDVVGRVHTTKFKLDHIIEKVYKYYSSRSENIWDEADFRECVNWTHKSLSYNNGEFNPLNMDMVSAEQAFDITINKPWAMYEYDMPDGTTLSGLLAIKGTIDQVSKIDNETYMILDFKTGRRWNWAKDHEKTYEHLNNDSQLLMYYYAARHIYPDIPHIMITIYFINDGGPFSICFSDEDIPRIERMLQKKFEDIKHTEIPRRNRSWKCTKFCHFGKNTFSGTNIPVIHERRDNQVCAMGEPMTMCEQTAYCLEHRPINTVIKNMSAPNHNIDFYKAPGSTD